jgi:hypothetical protein
MLINSDAGDLPNQPLVRQRLGPERVDREPRAVAAVSLRHANLQLPNAKNGEQRGKRCAQSEKSAFHGVSSLNAEHRGTAMLMSRTRRVNDAGTNPFSILAILSGNRLYFFAALRHSF